jgi:hypothetical protein
MDDADAFDSFLQDCPLAILEHWEAVVAVGAAARCLKPWEVLLLLHVPF